jgi:hypothetical protein
MRRPPNLFGIPCRLRTTTARAATLAVLRQIRRRCPADFAKLRELVRLIRPLPKRETADGTLGEWKADHPDENDWATWAYGYDATPGVLFLAEIGDALSLTATVAHEFGHACSSEPDRRRRGAPSGEWNSEFAADWYAYKWGFGRLIARDWRTRDRKHHGPGPGRCIAINGTRFRVSRRFVVHELPTGE